MRAGTVAEAGPSLYHVRVQDGGHEIDVVSEYGDGRVFGFEVKVPAHRVRTTPSIWLRDELGDRFVGGAVLRSGPRLRRLDEHIAAAPICSLADVSGSSRAGVQDRQRRTR